MAEHDHDGMTDEQLEKALAESVMPQGVSFETLESSAPAEPEPVAEPPVEPQPEPEPTPPAEPEPPAEQAETPDWEEVKAQLAAVDARAKHWEAVAGRTGGRLGFLEQQYQKLLASQRPPTTQPISEENGYDEVAARAPQPPPAPADDPVRQWAMDQARVNAALQFDGKYEDASKHAPVIADYLAKSGFNPNSVMASGDPVMAQQEFARALEEAYWHAKAIEAEALRAERVTKRAEQIRTTTEAKKKASISATGSAPPPKPRPKGMDEMSDAELEAEMLKATGGRW